MPTFKHSRMIWLTTRRRSTTSPLLFKHFFVNATIQDLLAPCPPTAQGHVMITKAKRTVKLALYLSLMRHLWITPMLMAQAHQCLHKKAKESHKKILALTKNDFDNNKLPKLKLGKTKSTAVK